MSLKYNKSDVRHAKEIFLQLREEEIETGHAESEEAMFSFGYGTVWPDGDVVSHNQLLFVFDDDGDLVDDPTIDGEE
jgi:hypothetical protein